MTNSAENRRQRIGSLSASLDGSNPRKRAEDVFPDLATPKVKLAPEPAPKPVPASAPKPPPAVNSMQAPKPARKAAASNASASRVVMNLPIDAADVLTRSRGTAGRTHAEVVFEAVEQAVRAQTLEALVRAYDDRGSGGEYFQRDSKPSGGVRQIHFRMSDENRTSLDRLVETYGAKSRTSLVAAALLAFRA